MTHFPDRGASGRYSFLPPVPGSKTGGAGAMRDCTHLYAGLGFGIGFLAAFPPRVSYCIARRGAGPSGTDCSMASRRSSASPRAPRDTSGPRALTRCTRRQDPAQERASVSSTPCVLHHPEGGVHGHHALCHLLELLIGGGARADSEDFLGRRRRGYGTNRARTQ